MKNKRLLMLIALVVVLAAGAGSYAWVGKFSPEARHKELLRYMLKDPDSAQFKEVRRSKRDKDAWCGELNARNSMGGMVGFKRYVFTSPGDLDLDPQKDRELFFLLAKLIEEGDSTFPGRWKAFCED